ncbi:MAG: hypothetical protein IID55_12865, partial [Proteobacteria bacterium]|nr:hypothetical protein [Pseudomonadota bacterium]
MALQIVEFFGFAPLHRSSVAAAAISNKTCPFIGENCIKPNHGACSVKQVVRSQPVICCPNRLYADGFKILRTIADEVFGASTKLMKPSEISSSSLTGDEVVVFGRYWGRELPLPRPQNSTAQASRKYYVDWILARLDTSGFPTEITAVEVQTIDTTGNYSDQVAPLLNGTPFTDPQGRTPGYSDAGLNWENVNKRILPQLIYKGHVLRRESKCRKGIYFVCPTQVY